MNGKNPADSRLLCSIEALKKRPAAFTLIELLVVVALIAVLAGLTLGTLGYVQGKGARARAEAEVAALTAAIESYYADNGVYPLMDNASSTATTNAITTTNLFQALCSTNTNAGTKVYFEPTPNMLSTTLPRKFVDPWGADYLYRTNTNSSVLRNIGSFDLYSTGGKPSATNQWIRN